MKLRIENFAVLLTALLLPVAVGAQECIIEQGGEGSYVDGGVAYCPTSSSCESSCETGGNLVGCSCALAKISGCGAVYCDGGCSCFGAQISDTDVVSCSHYRSCHSAQVSNAQAVVCEGELSCYFATISGDGSSLVSSSGKEALRYAEISNVGSVVCTDVNEHTCSYAKQIDQATSIECVGKRDVEHCAGITVTNSGCLTCGFNQCGYDSIHSKDSAFNGDAIPFEPNHGSMKIGPDCTEGCGDGFVNTPYLEDCEPTNTFHGECSDASSLYYDGGVLGCTENCQFDFDNCLYCGDGIKNGNEECDKDNYGGQTCKTRGYDDGDLACTDCKFDESGCSKCGDGVISGPEQCEEGKYNDEDCKSRGFTGGNIACSDCQFDTTGCYKCGNLQVEIGEQCDGNTNGESCQSLGFNGGILGCYAPTSDTPCQFDTTGCYKCQDGKKDPDEECDGENFDADDSCEKRGYSGGDLACNVHCQVDTSGCGISENCGNEKIDEDEDCDGKLLGGETCESQGFSSTGSLYCSDNCKFDTTACDPSCGDGVIAEDEQCEPSPLQLNGQNCITQGFSGGDLKCNNDCTFDTSKCTREESSESEPADPVCGNGVAEAPEDCDGADVPKTCKDFAHDNGGELKCTNDCKFDFSDCIQDADSGTGEQGCFSGDTTVTVFGKGPVMMKDLKVQDKVYSGSNSAGTPTYQEMYSFGHWQNDKSQEYIQLYHSNKASAPLELSSTHIIFLVQDTLVPTRADRVRVGDLLLVKDDGVKEAVIVTKIDRVIKKGAYMPLTRDGTIIVNNITASAYVSIQHEAPRIIFKLGFIFSEQTLFHWWLAPYRLVCMEVYPDLCKNDYNEEGIIHWLSFGEKLATFGETLSVLIQWIGLISVIPVLGVLVGLEAFLAASQLGLPFLTGLLLTVTIFLLRKGWLSRREKSNIASS